MSSKIFMFIDFAIILIKYDENNDENLKNLTFF